MSYCICSGSFQNASDFCLLKHKKDLLIDYLAILHLQFSKKDYKKIFSKIKYIIVSTRCCGGLEGGKYYFWMALKQETGGSQAG